MSASPSLLLDAAGRPVAGPVGRDAASHRPPPADLGKNVDVSVADVHRVPEWIDDLRAISPITDAHSWLLPFWYRAKARWVLYDCVPRALIRASEPQAVGLMGAELLSLLEGPPPRDVPAWGRTPFVSDAQHEMYRVHRVYARPFWVLQGESGGHQVCFSPDQKNFLTQIGAATEPPRPGDLPACPFDNRVTDQLRRLNRLVQLHGDLGKLRASGSGEAADVQQAIMEREVREVSMRMLEQQLGTLGEMVRALGHRTETQDSVIQATGQASKAADAIAAYIETGDYIM